MRSYDLIPGTTSGKAEDTSDSENETLRALASLHGQWAASIISHNQQCLQLCNTESDQEAQIKAVKDLKIIEAYLVWQNNVDTQIRELITSAARAYGAAKFKKEEEAVTQVLTSAMEAINAAHQGTFQELQVKIATCNQQAKKLRSSGTRALQGLGNVISGLGNTLFIFGAVATLLGVMIAIGTLGIGIIPALIIGGAGLAAAVVGLLISFGGYSIKTSATERAPETHKMSHRLFALTDALGKRPKDAPAEAPRLKVIS